MPCTVWISYIDISLARKSHLFAKPIFTSMRCVVFFLEPVCLFQSWFGSQTPWGLCVFVFPLRWKGDHGGKKQQWFPANYVEEISPMAMEPDRSVSRACVCVCVCLLCCVRGLYPCSRSRSAGHREQSSGRSPERKCGRVFLSDRWCVCVPLPWHTLSIRSDVWDLTHTHTHIRFEFRSEQSEDLR